MVSSFFALECGDLPMERVRPVEASQSRLTLYAESIRNLPLPSVVWDEFQRACRDGASSRQLAEIIKTDPVLVAAILKAANHSGLVLVEIVDVDRAIARIGHSMARGIVAHYSFSASSAKAGKVYDNNLLWRHGIAVSVLAEAVARFVAGCDAHVASTIGLFHDIGRMGFNLVAEYMLPATFDAEQGHLAYEHARFSCSHVELGVVIARHWRLPKQIEQGIANHHLPAYADADSVPEGVRAEVLAVYLADLLAIRAGLATGESGIAPPRDSYAELMRAPLAEIANDRKVALELEKLQHLTV